MIINTQNLEQAKNQIRKAPSLAQKPIIIKAQSLEFNRKILEYGKFDILSSIEFSSNFNETNPKYLNSGLNHILAKIASKNKISLGIDLNEIRSLNKKQKAIILARIKQNIKIARKAKTNIKLLNVKDLKNAQSFLLSLGTSTNQAKEAIGS